MKSRSLESSLPPLHHGPPVGTFGPSSATESELFSRERCFIRSSLRLLQPSDTREMSLTYSDATTEYTDHSASVRIVP